MLMFANVLLNEIARQRIHSWLCKACEVAFRWFHFDDFCAKVGQHACGMWPRKHAGEIKHTNALKRAFAPC